MLHQVGTVAVPVLIAFASDCIEMSGELDLEYAKKAQKTSRVP